MVQSIKCVTPAMLSISFSAEFARVGIGAATIIKATIRGAWKLAGIKQKEEPTNLTLLHVHKLIDELESRGCAPCDKQGKAYKGKALTQFAHGCVRTAHGEKKNPKPPLQETDADTPFDGPVSGTVPRDKVDNNPVNAAPSGDGKAALAALNGDPERAAIIAMAEGLRGSTDAKVKALVVRLLAYLK